MEDKAKQRAMEAYPPKFTEQKRYSKRVQSEKIDVHRPVRTVYIKGYHQAEKDNELTWEDMRKLYDLAYNLRFPHKKQKEFFEEVLKRFKERKDGSKE